LALSTKPWGSISESDYATPEAFCRACLIDMNEPGSEKIKALCKLPIREPGGALNRNGMLAAQGALVGARGGVSAPPDKKRAAARRLASMMRTNDMQPAESMMRMMGG